MIDRYRNPLNLSGNKRQTQLQLAGFLAQLETHRSNPLHSKDADCITANNCGHCTVCWARHQERMLLEDIAKTSKDLLA